MRTAALVLIALCICRRSPAESWRVLGPGGGGAQYRPTISPHDPRLLLATTDMSAGFLSEDEGATWRQFHLRAQVRSFLFDPVQPAVIFALLPGSMGLFRSADRGRSWALAYPPPDKVEALGFLDDEAEVHLHTRGSYPPLRAAATDPARSGVWYAVRGGRLETTSDSGRTWRALTAVDGEPVRTGNGGSLYVDPASPAAQRTVYVVTEKQVLFWHNGRARDGGPPGAARIVESSAGFSPASLYVLTEPRGLWVTRDHGVTWQALHPAIDALAAAGRPRPALRGIATAAARPMAVYVSYSNLYPAAGGEPALGVLRSADGGRTWLAVWSDRAGQPDPKVRDAWLTPRFGVDWGENPLEIGVHATDPSLVLATDLGRTMRSRDSGATWDGVYSRSLPGGGWTTTGLDMTTNYGVHFDPFDARRLFVSYTDIGLFRSDDGGASWRDSSAGMPRAWRNTTYWTLFDPQVRGRMWAATSGVHDLPRMKMVRRWKPAEGRWHGGVCASADGGLQWWASSRGLPDLPVTHLLLDPRSQPAARVLYAASFGGGVYKSADGGASWTRASQGIAGERPLVWRLAMAADGVLYAVVARGSESLEYGNAGDGALYRSAGGGAQWQRVSLPAGVNGPTGIAIDPSDSRRLYVSAAGRFRPGDVSGPRQGGIYLSEDGGLTWRAVFERDQYLYDVTLNPARPAELFSTGYQSSLWRSTDRGATWRRVPGFRFKAAHRAIPDPRRAGMIFVTTYGGSVWYGPSEGDPSDPEDIVTPVVSYRGR